jgi:hypothetical protein
VPLLEVKKEKTTHGAERPMVASETAGGHWRPVEATGGHWRPLEATGGQSRPVEAGGGQPHTSFIYQ